MMERKVGKVYIWLRRRQTVRYHNCQTTQFMWGVGSFSVSNAILPFFFFFFQASIPTLGALHRSAYFTQSSSFLILKTVFHSMKCFTLKLSIQVHTHIHKCITEQKFSEMVFIFASLCIFCSVHCRLLKMLVVTHQYYFRPVV